MTINVERIRENGVVGAGGAGFPTYRKLQHNVDVVILNGAECEPLMHKDKELLRNYAREIVLCLDEIVAFVGASRAYIAIKAKYRDVIEAVKQHLTARLTIAPLGDFYPAGDEIVLVHLVTGRIIPAGKIPLDSGCLVNNVETIYNVAQGHPVTDSVITVAGAIPKPVTLQVPVGTLIEDLLPLLRVDDYQSKTVILGGAMMGTLVQRFDEPIRKTTGGLIILPADHPLIKKYERTAKQHVLIGSSCCDQCSLCTDLCPRYLLGHPIQPHLAMRALQIPDRFHHLNYGTHFCCECNLCSLMSCPIDLDPKEVCVSYKRQYALDESLASETRLSSPHTMVQERRVSLSRLKHRLGLGLYQNEAPLVSFPAEIKRVRIPLKQHIGETTKPVVSIDQQVLRAEKIADLEPHHLGVPIHASITGRVTRVEPDYIEIQRT
ncbi:4Fe-4S dicluster domain-containing protein [candidate division CSSED10-310 bacterium]|uniref:4Fe-4S dicluster domain-containing protein n=1 Tax=candidate division CSSED10-310 bacterium TaxID=2855610 RepID=A0ABV6Z2M1_UNCC1